MTVDFTKDIKLRSRTKEKIQNEYLCLSRVMRSVSGQITSQVHLKAHQYENIAALNRDLGFFLYDAKTRRFGNFWYRIHAGRIMKPSKYLGHFLDTVNWYTAQMLRHYLWKLIDQQITPEQAIKHLPKTMKRLLFTKQDCHSKGNKLLLESLKQSYKKQRLNLYYQHDFDSLAALLIYSVIQVQKLKHERPTTAEQFAYAQFLYLFGYKYRTHKKLEMGNKINLLIAGSSPQKGNDNLNQRLILDFEKVEEIKIIGVKSQVGDLDQFVSDEILKNILSKPHHHYFYS